jgi:hypothetical protein
MAEDTFSIQQSHPARITTDTELNVIVVKSEKGMDNLGRLLHVATSKRGSDNYLNQVHASQSHNSPMLKQLFQQMGTMINLLTTVLMKLK